MKKWNKPELLNLNLQETKTEEYKRPGHGNNQGNNNGLTDHICLQTNSTCKTTHLDGYDACAAGHSVTAWDERYADTGCIATCCAEIVYGS